MSTIVYFENYCNKIYKFLFTYMNFIIIIKILGIISFYYLLKFLKSYNYFILIDDFILYLIHIITIVFLFIRLVYSYIIKSKIILSFYTIQTSTYELFSIYIIGNQNADSEDADISESYNFHNSNYYNSDYKNQNLIIHNPNNNYLEIQEFKDLLLFYISYFISIIFKLYEEPNIYISNTQIYENYCSHKFSKTYYNYNTNLFKLQLINYNIKLLLAKSYNNGNINSHDYKQAQIFLQKITTSIQFLYLYLNNKTIETDKNLFLGIFNQNNVLIKFIHILNDILIFISLIFTIIYYINYISSLFYIIILSFFYLYLNTIIYIPIYFNQYSINLHQLLINIHDEIQILYSFSKENNNIIYK